MNLETLNRLPGLETALKLYKSDLVEFEKNYSKAKDKLNSALHLLEVNNTAASLVNTISSKEIKIIFNTTYGHSHQIIDADIPDLIADEVKTIDGITELKITNKHKENKNIIESWLIKANDLIEDIQNRHAKEADYNSRHIQFIKGQIDIIETEIKNILYGGFEPSVNDTSLFFDKTLSLSENIDLIIKKYKETYGTEKTTLSKKKICKITRRVYDNKFASDITLREFAGKVYPALSRKLKINGQWTKENFENLLSKTGKYVSDF